MSPIKKAYKILENVTPLETDCGKLCGRACCAGGSEQGMYLFPGEEKLFAENSEDWFTITESSVVTRSGEKIFLFTCKGTCPREKRPLACRIFPLMPYLTHDSILEIRPDPKAAALCPLLSPESKEQISEEFIDALYDAFALLIDDEKIIDFIELLSADYNDMARLLFS